MYAWGGDTGGWRGKKGYTYGSARARYDASAKAAGATGSRSYDMRREPDMDLVDPKGKLIKSDSTDPIIVAVDVTGSMAEWPGEIFDRLPLLYQTLAKYRPDAEFSFCAIGDATCDSYPLQVNDFTKDIKSLEKSLKALGCEGGGGGQVTESYELFAYFMANRCETPNATSPFLLIYGDESFYPNVDVKQVKHFMGVKAQSPLESKTVFDKLKTKFNVYHLRKPYPGHDAMIEKDWADAIGKQRIVGLPSRDRAVDVGMGLIAKQWGEYGDFSTSLDARHDDSSVKAGVHKSLRFIDANPSAKSVMKKSSSSSSSSRKKSRATKSLL
jgi:hypothetical protein